MPLPLVKGGEGPGDEATYNIIRQLILIVNIINAIIFIPFLDVA